MLSIGKEMEIGGFTNEEIQNFDPKELEYIIKKLVHKGRDNGTKRVDSAKGQADARQAWLDAMEIYERAPASEELPDKTVIFPVYSGIYAWIKGGKVKSDKVDWFEQNLAQKFVMEARLHDIGSVHFLRAMAMQIEVTARTGDYKAALKYLKLLKASYDPQKHSREMDRIYGTDRAAQALSQGAVFYHMMGNDHKALNVCNHLIDNVLPQLDATNTLGMFEFLMPILRVLKPLGQSMRCYVLFNEHVHEAFLKNHGPFASTPTKSLHKPILWLFQLSHVDLDTSCDEFEEIVHWLLVDENGIPSDFLDTLITRTTWSPSDISAELCLLVAKKLEEQDEQNDNEFILKKIVGKGVHLVRAAHKKITKEDNDSIELEIAYELHEPVMIELEDFATRLELEIATVDQQEKIFGGSRSWDLNLPPSFIEIPKEVERVDDESFTEGSALLLGH